VENPELLSDASKEADLLRLFPADAIARARLLTKSLGSVGAYSHSMGTVSPRQRGTQDLGFAAAEAASEWPTGCHTDAQACRPSGPTSPSSSKVLPARRRAIAGAALRYQLTWVAGATQAHPRAPPERDGGIKSNPEHIFLTAGASDAVKMVLNMLISSDKTGVRPGAALARNMCPIDADGAARLGAPCRTPAAAHQVLIPIPQYPLYTATLALYNGRAVPYYLDEDGQWSLSVRRAHLGVPARGCGRLPHVREASRRAHGRWHAYRRTSCARPSRRRVRRARTCARWW